MESRGYQNMRDAYQKVYLNEKKEDGDMPVAHPPHHPYPLRPYLPIAKVTKNEVKIDVTKDYKGPGGVEKAYYTYPAGFDPTNREDITRKGVTTEDVEVTDEEFFNFMVENGITESVEAAETVFEHMSDDWFEAIYNGLMEAKNEEGKEQGLDGKACWKGYKRMGTKKKGGKTVDNCVKA